MVQIKHSSSFYKKTYEFYNQLKYLRQDLRDFLVGTLHDCNECVLEKKASDAYIDNPSI